MKYSIIGCGKFGQKHLKTLLELNKEVVFVCNRTLAKLAEVTSIYENLGKPDLNFTTSVDDVLQSDTDIVVIATEPKEHYELVKKSLNAGKHVICEKPLVFKVEESLELYKLAKEKNLLLIVNYSPLFIPTVVSVLHFQFKKILENKESARVFYQNNGCGPEREYSTIWDYAPHSACLAYLLSFSNIYKQTHVFRFDSALKSFISDFSDGNINLCIQFGNSFPSRQHGLTVSLPAKYLDDKDQKGKATYMLDFSKAKTLEVLYNIVEDAYLKEPDFCNPFLSELSHYVTHFCCNLEEQCNNLENETASDRPNT